MPDQFNFNDIFGGNGIFGSPKVQALQEQLKAKDEEIARLKATILRCPKCGTKLRIPR